MDDWTKKFEDYYFNDDYLDDQLNNSLYEECPNCGKLYDDIDFDYQICHFCRYDANKKD